MPLPKTSVRPTGIKLRDISGPLARQSTIRRWGSIGRCQNARVDVIMKDVGSLPQLDIARNIIVN